MDDYYEDDFFDEGDFDENFESEDSLDDDPEMGDEPDKADSHEDFTTRDAFILGGAMGWAYEEGIDEAKRRKLEKKMQDDEGVRNRDPYI